MSHHAPTFIFRERAYIVTPPGRASIMNEFHVPVRLIHDILQEGPYLPMLLLLSLQRNKIEKPNQNFNLLTSAHLEDITIALQSIAAITLAHQNRNKPLWMMNWLEVHEPLLGPRL